MEPDIDATPTVSAPPRHRGARRTGGLLIAAVLAVTVLAGCLSEDQVTVQTKINTSRSANGLGKLTDYQTADTKAQAWAQHLADIGGLEHSNLPSGYKSGTWCRLGENVGMGPSLSSIHTAFMNSAGHRANILGPYDHVGTGVVKKGAYYYVVQEFVDLC